MKLLFQVAMVSCIHFLHAQPTDETEVVASLYGTVTLRCWFPFIRGREGLSVVWEKNDKDGRRSIAHKFIEGQDILRDQDIDYTGRTELSGDFSYGTVDLTLKEVTFSDEGTYYCRAANGKGHGDKKVDLTIGNLNAEESTVTVIHIDGKHRLKCINIGVFRNPWVRWYDEQSRDLSEHGTRNITDISNGRKMVASVLNFDVETNKSYFCLVKEGRLKRTARAVISGAESLLTMQITKVLFISLFACADVIVSEKNDFTRLSNVSLVGDDTEMLTDHWQVLRPSRFIGKDNEVTYDVSTFLYGTAHLPCSFPFIRGPETLTLIWKKEEEKNKLCIHSFKMGQEHHLEQDCRYEGRTKLSTKFPQGDLGLTLRGVTFADVGTYYCHAANTFNAGIQKVELSISGLNVHSRAGTLSDVDGKKRLTCITIGMFRDPWVRWYDVKNTTLTEYETHHITDEADGLKKVESVLRYDDEINEMYFCQVGEGTLHTTTRIVRSVLLEEHPDLRNRANPERSHLAVGLTKAPIKSTSLNKIFLAILIGILTRC